MAANLQNRGLASVGKHIVRQINYYNASSPSLLSRRAVHVSVYDKNLEENVRPAVVPDEVIQLNSDKYWAPHPQTGVFGPATDHSTPATGGESGFHFSSGSASENSVLEQKAFFRSLEDLEKPPHP